MTSLLSLPLDILDILCRFTPKDARSTCTLLRDISDRYMDVRQILDCNLRSGLTSRIPFLTPYLSNDQIRCILSRAVHSPDWLFVFMDHIEIDRDILFELFYMKDERILDFVWSRVSSTNLETHPTILRSMIFFDRRDLVDQVLPRIDTRNKSDIVGSIIYGIADGGYRETVKHLISSCGITNDDIFSDDILKRRMSKTYLPSWLHSEPIFDYVSEPVDMYSLVRCERYWMIPELIQHGKKFDQPHEVILLSILEIMKQKKARSESTTKLNYIPCQILSLVYIDPSLWIDDISIILRPGTFVDEVFGILNIHRDHPEIYYPIICSLPCNVIDDIVEKTQISLTDHENLLLMIAVLQDNSIFSPLPELPQEDIDKLYQLNDVPPSFLIQAYSPSFEVAKSILLTYPEIYTARELIRRIDISEDESFLLRQAVKDNQIQYVHLYLNDGRSDPSVRNQWCYRYAVQMKYEDIRLRLIQDHRVVQTQSRRKKISY